MREDTNETQQKTKLPGFMVYFEEALIWDKYLTDEELAQLMRAVIHYGNDGSRPDDMPMHLKIFFDQMRGKIDRDRKKYEKTCKNRSEAALRREAKKKVRESQNKEEENVDNKKKNEEKEVTIVQSCDNGAELSQFSQQALTSNPYPVTVTPNRVTPNPSSSSSIIAELSNAWQREFTQPISGQDISLFKDIAAHGYTLDDATTAFQLAKLKADTNPHGYIRTLLADWQKNGRPKPPSGTIDTFTKHVYSAADFAAMTVDLDADETP